MQSLDIVFSNFCASHLTILILAYQANSLDKVEFTKFASKIIWMSHWRHTMVDGAEFWISCECLALLSIISSWQLIQNSAPSTIVWHQCDIQMGLAWGWLLAREANLTVAKSSSSSRKPLLGLASKWLLLWYYWWFTLYVWYLKACWYQIKPLRSL